MSFAKVTRMDARMVHWIAIVALLVASLLPAVIATNKVDAAGQVTNRSIDISTSEVSATNVTYDVSFDVATNSSTSAIVVQFCSDSPIVGLTCTAPTGMNILLASGDVTDNGSTTTLASITEDTTNSNANTLIFSFTAQTPSVGDTIAFSLAGVTNPSTTGSYYARILTYSSLTDAQGYSDTAPDSVGNHIDDGGIALSTAQQITINARVQERLTFCVGTTDPTAQCSGGSYSGGTLVDLDVVDNTKINEASDEGTGIAYAQVTTNASNGVVVSYFGDDLKVSGATCGTTDIEGTPTSTDKCFNTDADPDNGSNTSMTAGTEQWGIAVTSTPDDGTTTNNLTATAAYDYDASDEYTFVANTTTQLASSTGSTDKVVDSEQLNIDVAATAAITTPTGLYSTVLTFIATSTF